MGENEVNALTVLKNGLCELETMGMKLVEKLESVQFEYNESGKSDAELAMRLFDLHCALDRWTRNSHQMNSVTDLQERIVNKLDSMGVGV